MRSSLRPDGFRTPPGAALTGLRKRGYAIASDRSDRTRSTVCQIARTESGGDACVAPATATADGDGDYAAGPNPPKPKARKAAARTGRAA